LRNFQDEFFSPSKIRQHALKLKNSNLKSEKLETQEEKLPLPHNNFEKTMVKYIQTAYMSSPRSKKMNINIQKTFQRYKLNILVKNTSDSQPDIRLSGTPSIAESSNIKEETLKVAEKTGKRDRTPDSASKNRTKVSYSISTVQPPENEVMPDNCMGKMIKHSLKSKYDLSGFRFQANAPESSVLNLRPVNLPMKANKDCCETMRHRSPFSSPKNKEFDALLHTKSHEKKK
jgi:hypothetical protein